MYIERIKLVARYAKHYDICHDKKFSDEVIADFTKKFSSMMKKNIDKKDLMNIFHSFLKIVYNAAVESEFDFKKIAKDLQCSSKKVYHYAQDYEVIHKVQNGYMVKKGIRLKPCYYILNELMYTEFIEHICSIINKFNINLDTLVLGVPKFVDKFYDGNTLVQKSLLSKLKLYEKHLKHEDEKSLDGIDIINEYLKSDIRNGETFCKTNNLSRAKLHNGLAYLEEIDHPLFQEFYKHKEYLKAQELNKLYLIACDLICSLKNGILDNGRLREYDIIDYLTTYNIDIKELIRVKNKFSYDDVTILAPFIYNTQKHMKDANMSTRSFININKSNKFERSLTEVEKELCIKKLESMGVCINIATCNAIAKRYLNGFIELSPKVIKK